MSLRESILNCQDLDREPIELPAWQAALGGAQLYVRAMTAWEADRLGEAAENKQRNYAARIAVLTLVDESGTRVFQDSDIKALREKNAKEIERIASVALRLSGMDRQAQQDAKKNSVETTTEEPPTDSQFL